MEKWTTLWSYAQRNTAYTSWQNQSSFSFTIKSPVAASAIRLRYSNFYNPSPVEIQEVLLTVSDETNSSSHPVSDRVVIGPGKSLVSSVIEQSIHQNSSIKIDMYFSTEKNPLSGSTFDGYVVMILQSIEILTENEVSTIACFGDSITHQGQWTAPLFERIYSTYPGKMCAFELGINGNRLLYNSPRYLETLGYSGVNRLEQDILNLPGITHVICALGINDIGLPGTEKIPFSEFPTFENMIEGYSQISEQLRKAGIKPLAATITPRIWEGGHEQEREQLRLDINKWLMDSTCFDHVFDFSTPLSTTNRMSGLYPDYDCGDGVHINALGGQKLQNAIDVKAFCD